MHVPLCRPARSLAVICAAGAVLSVLPAGSSAADSVSKARAQAAAAAAAAAAARAKVSAVSAQVSAVQKQLAVLDVQSEVAAEAFNAAVDKLAWANRVATAARHRLSTATAILLSVRSRAGAVAINAYQSGGLGELSLLTDDGGPGTFLDRVSALGAMAAVQQGALVQLRNAEHEQAFAKVAAEAAVTNQRTLAAEKKKERDAVLAAARRQQVLLGQLQDAQKQLVVAATAALAHATAANHAVDVAVAQRALALARARAAELAKQRAAQAAASRAFTTSSHSSSSPPPPVVLGSGGAATAVAWAYREIGKPYVWAAAGPDAFDCSGLTQYVWAKAGVSLSHYSGAQYGQGSRVDKSQLRPGDLVFFGSPIHHVGIYVGGGDMIDAPHTGAFVRKEPMWWPQYVGAVRP